MSTQIIDEKAPRATRVAARRPGAGLRDDIRRGDRPARTSKALWSIEELNRIFHSARFMPGMIGTAWADHWWTAFLLTMLDTGAGLMDLLMLAPSAFNRRAGVLTVGSRACPLRPVALSALLAIAPEGNSAINLFPRTVDRAGRPNKFLRRLRSNLRKLLWRAGLPITKPNLFVRLRSTARQSPGAIDEINLLAAFELRRNPPRFAGARARRRTARARRREANRRRDPLPRGSTGRRRTTVKRPRALVRTPRAPGPLFRDPRPDVLLIRNDSPRTLRRVFREEYSPRRLAGKARDSIQDHETAIERLSWFCAADVTIDQLSDALLERFMGWCLKSGRSASTANGAAGSIYTLWRFAFSEGLLDRQPRKRHKMAVAKRLPEAWSLEEFGRLLRAASETEGWIGSVPASIWWPPLLLLLFDTGLRINAVLMLAPSALDAHGWLTVPAEFQKQKTAQSMHLHADTLRSLMGLRASGDRLFPTPWKSPVVQLRRRFRRIVKRAGLPSGPRDMFHKIRRTTATYIADATCDEMAQRQLGHSSVSLTRAAYIDPRKIHRRIELADVMQRPQWSPGPIAGPGAGPSVQTTSAPTVGETEELL